jgi:hypothetical protein
MLAAHEPREASWSAPALWRFGQAGGTRGAARNYFTFSMVGIRCNEWPAYLITNTKKHG